MPRDKYKAKIDEMEREKNFEFKESLDDLYRSEQGRQHLIEKLDKDDPGDGFRPQSFKSSRSTQKNQAKLSAEQTHENLVYGTRKFQEISASKKVEESETASVHLEAPIEVNVVSSSSNLLMHESLFEDIMIKENRWKQKMLDLIRAVDFATTETV